MRLFKKLRRKLDYLDSKQTDKVHEAYLIAHRAHKGQKRLTGEPYITHPVAVAGMLADLKMDFQTIIAALLHDVIEDTPVVKEEISAQFGDVVANLVDGVSKLTQIEFVSRIEAQAENFQKMVWAMAHDIRVIIIKLADRLHNMRTLGPLASQKKRRIARETLEIFAPIARRLGMHEFSVELEELGFGVLHPLRHKILKEAVQRARGDRKKILAIIEKTLHEGLVQAGITCTISGREKNLYSIYRKMRAKHIPFNEIMDVYAFRIIVDDVTTCYRVLGVVHGLFKPVPGRFKDYIAIPKANGYQSLHTTLFGPYGLPIEMQVRTTDMDKTAISGVAAHWLYKSDEDVESSQFQMRAQQWVKKLLELHRDAVNPLEFIENVKTDLFPEEVYVFTPKGDIMGLPAGSTAVDFAYTVHTDIGDSCKAVKVNRQFAPLSTVLRSGQSVEIITSAAARPNPAWLDFVVTSKARSGVRHFLKNQRRSESIALGRQLLKKALLNYSLNFKKISNIILDIVLKETHLKNLDDLLEQIGLGNRVAMLVAQRFALLSQETEDEDELPVLTSVAQPLSIKGTEGLVVNFATCCYPIPGDPIVGVVEVGKGVLIHSERCQEIAKFRQHPERCMPLRWYERITVEFPVLIRIQVINEIGVLANLTSVISEMNANIEDFKIETREGMHYLLGIKILVKDRLHLAKIFKRLREVTHVVKIFPRS